MNSKKMLKVIPENIPEELKAIDQWVCWKLSSKSNQKKETKIPFNPNNKNKAKTNDPTTWGNFQTALNCYNNSGRFDGIG